MDWFQSSQIGQQFWGETGGSNFRKGYRVGNTSKNCDPDNSDTPLLHENLPSPGRENAQVWLQQKNKGTCEESYMEEKPLKNVGRSIGSMSPSVFNKESAKPGSSAVESHNCENASYKLKGKASESEKLLIDFGQQGKNEGNWSVDDDDDDDDDPFVFDGYKKLKTTPE